jgi:ATP-dependent phosphoenolpyruvate carboxykinase
VKGIAEGTIEWEVDPDFHYLVASFVPGIDAEDLDVLQPRRLYEAAGRAEDYRALAERFKSERAEFLKAFPSLSEEIISAVR